jgi:uncharacterized DUF497 family protein
MKEEFKNVIGFQWDEANADKNRIAHYVENWECEQIFFNDPLLILDDPRHSAAEKRWAALGCTNSGRPLTVVFTKRGKLIRVISARDMNRKERRFYEEKG